jgi:hypothetical protein
MKDIRMTLTLIDRIRVYPKGLAEDVLVQVREILIPNEFVIMDIEPDEETPILLGRPFLSTGKTKIEVETRDIKFKVSEGKVRFIIHNTTCQNSGRSECYKIDMIKTLAKEEMKPADPGIERAIVKSLENENEELDEKSNLSIRWLNSEQP